MCSPQRINYIKERAGSAVSLSNQIRALFTKYGSPSGITDPDPTLPNPADGEIGVMPILSSFINSFARLNDDRHYSENGPHGIVGGGGPTVVMTPKLSTSPPTSAPPQQTGHAPSLI
jgi:hypothetical protein